MGALATAAEATTGTQAALHGGLHRIVITMRGSGFRIEANGETNDSFTDARWPNGPRESMDRTRARCA